MITYTEDAVMLNHNFANADPHCRVQFIAFQCVHLFQEQCPKGNLCETLKFTFCVEMSHYEFNSLFKYLECISSFKLQQHFTL